MYHLKETWLVQPLIIEKVIYLLLQRTPVSMIKHLLQITVNIFNDDTNLLSENMTLQAIAQKSSYRLKNELV